MATTHDDLPHPVPTAAYLRWKENWFFIVMDIERAVHGVVHFNFEPGYDRARFTCHLNVLGQVHSYFNETRFPEDFQFARQIGDDRMKLRFVEPNRRFSIVLESDGLSFDLTFEKSRPTFDFAACRFAAPEIPSFQEVMTLGTNLPYNHQQQALMTSGLVVTRRDGKEQRLAISGYGYRDHSWCMRYDGACASHTWSGLHFGNRAFGVKKLRTLLRPEVWAREGYVSDENGERALSEIEVFYEGSSTGGLPEVVRFELGDVFRIRFTIKCDVAGRYAQVPLVAEQPGKHSAYSITECFCPCVIEETGETGCALVEIGTTVT